MFAGTLFSGHTSSELWYYQRTEPCGLIGCFRIDRLHENLLHENGVENTKDTYSQLFIYTFSLKLAISFLIVQDDIAITTGPHFAAPKDLCSGYSKSRYMMHRTLAHHLIRPRPNVIKRC